MKATVYSVKPSKSGNHDILSLATKDVRETPFGKQEVNNFYSMLMVLGECKLSEGEEIDIDMNLFDVRVSKSQGYSDSLWLEFKG